jgi:tRNA pseudouridine55 synthase
VSAAIDSGVLVVDKPGGLTSFDVVQRVRGATGNRRVGHTGTLDPMATGVLPVCVGEATKLVPFLMGGDKIYAAEVVFGVTTDTLDATGRILDRRSASSMSEGQLREVLSGFIGTIRQRPPAHSAVHVGGKRAYELARAGHAVELSEREVVIHEARLETFDPSGAATACARLTVRCGMGTYIRSLAADLGERLGCGAHLSALRRLKAGGFSIEQAIPIAQLTDRPDGDPLPVVALADALSFLPAVRLKAEQVQPVRDGKLSVINAIPPPDQADRARLLRPDGTLLAVAEVVGGNLRLARVFC